jgi:hypothetical protein
VTEHSRGSPEASGPVRHGRIRTRSRRSSHRRSRATGALVSATPDASTPRVNLATRLVIIEFAWRSPLGVQPVLLLDRLLLD